MSSSRSRKLLPLLAGGFLLAAFAFGAFELLNPGSDDGRSAYEKREDELGDEGGGGTAGSSLTGAEVAKLLKREIGVSDALCKRRGGRRFNCFASPPDTGPIKVGVTVPEYGKRLNITDCELAGLKPNEFGTCSFGPPAGAP